MGFSRGVVLFFFQGFSRGFVGYLKGFLEVL